MHNPSESYDYFSYPFCDPKEQIGEGLSYAITGSRKYISAYDIRFGEDRTHAVLCKKAIQTKAQQQQLLQLIEKDFFFLMHIDDLPLREHVGYKKSLPGQRFQYFLYTHLEFVLEYNANQIISISLSRKFNPFDVSKLVDPASGTTTLVGSSIEFTYSVLWKPTEKKFVNRLEKYVDSHLYPEDVEIQWFSIVNSLVLVVLLCCFLAFIMLRILRRDVQKFTDPEEPQENGWKFIHGDVFRFPQHITFLAAFLGNGCQLLSLSLAVLALSLLGVFYPDYSNRTMYLAIIVVYVLTTGINGFVSGMFYKQLGGEQWVGNVLCSTTLFVAPLLFLWAIMNTVALLYQSTAALSFRSIMIISQLYLLISFPLMLLGAITAKNFTSSSFNAPCRTKKAIREIPNVPWYKGTLVQVLVAGFLPFSAIYVELYYAFASLWGTIMYTPYPILAVAFGVLVLVTACITVAMTYLQISQEDWAWWWRSAVAGGSTSLFILAYAIFFYYFQSLMEGFMQFAFYFGYTLMVCWGFFLMLGTVGFLSSLHFLKIIYGVIRID